jgi:hypothetical protein
MRNFVSHIKKYTRSQSSANFTLQNAVLTQCSTPKPMRLRFPLASGRRQAPWSGRDPLGHHSPVTKHPRLP